MCQVWKTIPGYERYEVSNDGQVRSWLKRGNHSSKATIAPHLMKPVRDAVNRPLVTLSNNGVAKRFYIHVLVLAAFVGPRPSGQEACHIDGDLQNNHIANLRWDTHKSNEQDKKRHGTAPTGEKNARSKLTEQDVIEIRHLSTQGVRHDEIAQKFNVKANTISRIANGKRWKHANGPVHDSSTPYRNSQPKTNYFSLHPEIAKGENNGRAILDEHKVRQIRQRSEQGEKRSDLALEYGVSKATIQHIVSRRLWKHVD